MSRLSFGSAPCLPYYPPWVLVRSRGDSAGLLVLAAYTSHASIPTLLFCKSLATRYSAKRSEPLQTVATTILCPFPFLSLFKTSHYRNYCSQHGPQLLTRLNTLVTLSRPDWTNHSPGLPLPDKDTALLATNRYIKPRLVRTLRQDEVITAVALQVYVVSLGQLGHVLGSSDVYRHFILTTLLTMQPDRHSHSLRSPSWVITCNDLSFLLFC